VLKQQSKKEYGLSKPRSKIEQGMPTRNLLDQPSNQEASAEGQTALRSLINVRPIKRNYKTSHSAPRTDNDKRRLTKTAAILFS